MRLWPCLITALWLAAPLPAAAQDAGTLADIRQDLTVLFIELQRLRGELNTTGPSEQTVDGATLRDRLNSIEGAIQTLTARVEDLEFRVDRVTDDGTRRIGDLEFRLCELEPACDLNSLGRTPTLGGEELDPLRFPGEPAEEGPVLAVAEQADFDAAANAVEAGDYATAVTLFVAFGETYPGSPLSTQAHFLRGEALEGLGQMRDAARAYLDAFNIDPAGPLAPDALFRLGRSIAAFGQLGDACLTLAEVGVRFPGAPAETEARITMQSLGCS